MLGKMEMRSPPGSRPRDGHHCDLCGCSQPAVRCDKCGCQIFCLSCDDMYHRHPKRRFHLRKAVDSIPPVPQARPVLPVKVAHLNTTNPGDPSKMPLPPPRKKKSLFGSFRRPSPSSDNSPPLPKKEYSWTDRLGSIKKFMSNRPLPPLPTTDDNDGETQPTTNGQTTPPRGDLAFIHKRSEERPPQLPARSPRSQEFSGFNQDNNSRTQNAAVNVTGQIRNGALEPNMNHMIQGQDFSSEESQWNRMPNQNGTQAFGTMNRHNQRGYMHPGGPGFTGGMHQSSSATDLHRMQNSDTMQGFGPLPPHYPHYPMNPHMPPHYPYPMYPQYPNYPQYFGNSFANLSNPPTTDGDVSDSATSMRHSKKQSFRKRAKRSQSVMMDRMAYPAQFYPFGPYPGYGPWGAPMPMESPPSPASSIRSLNRTGRSRRRKKLTSEDEEELSVSSSPLSRPKSSSSDRPAKDNQRAPLATQTSSEDESEYDAERRRSKMATIQRKSETMPIASSPVPGRKKPPPIQRKNSSTKQSDSDSQEVPQIQYERRSSKDSATENAAQEQISSSPSTWECKHCTFINPMANKICIVCCKTASPRTETPNFTNSRPSSSAESGRKQSLGSEKSCTSPENAPEVEDESSKKDKQDMAILNSALDEAEKEITRGLEELMKLKDDMDTGATQGSNVTQSSETTESTKPVYKSSGKMRTSILDKLNLSKPQTSKTSTSTSTEVQTEQKNRNTDKIIEARRYSNSSNNSETYNSPLAQSPVLGSGFNTQKRDSSCQTQQDNLAEYLERKRAAEEAFLGRPINNFGFGYTERMDMMTSPVPSMYDRYMDRGFGMMQRSHSRASLFTGRMNDLGPMDYGGPAFGYGATPMYRSISRGSLTGDYPDSRMSEFHGLRKPDYYLSMEELVERRRQEDIKAQGLELVRMIREAEQQGFTADDIQVALTHCGKQSPMEWLQNNWRNMVDSVITLSTNYGNDKKENDIGLLSENEARDALRMHKGNIWAAVTECVESRQRKYLELSARGKFSRQDIIDSLTASDGDVEMAYANLSKATGKPFLMRIWGAGEGAQNQDGARPLPEDLKNGHHLYHKDVANSDELSGDDMWSEDGAEVNWEDEEEDYEEERGDFEDLQTCHEDLNFVPQEVRTPESDKSDYCDAFALEERNVSSPSDDIFFVIPEAKPEKKKGFLSKLAALRKNSKEQIESASNMEDDTASKIIPESKKDTVSQNSNSSGEQTKGNGALSAIKNTFTAFKDTVTGASKSEKKVPCAQPERRTIIVTGKLDHEPLSFDTKDNVNITSVKAIENNDLTNERTKIKSGEMGKESKEHEDLEKDIARNATKSSVGFGDQDGGGFNLKSNQVDSNIIEKQSDSKIKLENNKTQSFAERLKFAKKSYPLKASPNSEDAMKDMSVINTSDVNKTMSVKDCTSSDNDNLVEDKKEKSVFPNSVSGNAESSKQMKVEEKNVDNNVSETSVNSKMINKKDVEVKSAEKENEDVENFRKTGSSLDPRNEHRSMLENASPTLVEFSSAENQVICDKNIQENALETTLQNISQEQIPVEKIFPDKHEHIAKLSETSNSNNSLSNNASTSEIKEVSNNTMSNLPVNNTNSKSDTVIKTEEIVNDILPHSNKNSTEIFPVDNSEVPTSTNELELLDARSRLEEFTKSNKAMSNDLSIVNDSITEQKLLNSQNEVKPGSSQDPSAEGTSVVDRIELVSVLHENTDSSQSVSISSNNLNSSVEPKSDSSPKLTTEAITFPEAKEDSYSSTSKIHNAQELKLDALNMSEDKINVTQESKSDTTNNSEDKVKSSQESNFEASFVLADKIELKPTLLSGSADNNNDVLHSTAAEPDNKTVNALNDIILDEKVATHKENKTNGKQVNSLKTNDISQQIKQVNDSPIDGAEKVTSFTNTEEIDSHSKSSQDIPSVMTDKKIAKQSELVLTEKASDAQEPELKTSSNIEPTTKIENAEIVKEPEAEIRGQTKVSTSVSNLEKQPEQQNVKDSNSTQNTEIPGCSKNDTDGTSIDKNNAAIIEKNTKDTGPTITDGLKSGKLKISKSGKIKKIAKSNKDVLKDSVKAETPLVTSTSTVSSSIKQVDENVSEMKAVSLEIETPKPTSEELKIPEPTTDEKVNKHNLNNANTESNSSASGATTHAVETEILISGEEKVATNTIPPTQNNSLLSKTTQAPHEHQTSSASSIAASQSVTNNLNTENTAEYKTVEQGSHIVGQGILTLVEETNKVSISDASVKNIHQKSSFKDSVKTDHIFENNRSVNQIAVSQSTTGSGSKVNVNPDSNITSTSVIIQKAAGESKVSEAVEGTDSNIATTLKPKDSEQHSTIDDAVIATKSAVDEEITAANNQRILQEKIMENSDNTSQAVDSDDTDIQYSDDSRPSSVTPPSPVDALRSRFEILSGGISVRGPVRPQSPFRRMSFNSRKQVIALERIRDTATDKPWYHQKTIEPIKVVVPKRSIKQQLEMERRVRKMVADRKVRTYRKAEIVIQLMDMNFEEEEAILAATECSTLELAFSFLQQECLLCAGHFPVSQIVSMTHCQHRACRECIRAYFTVQIRDRTILDLLCPFCNEPDIGDEDVAQDYFNHLDIMLKKLVDMEIHELFQRKLRDRVLMKDPNFRWCSQCSSGFIAMPNLKRLICPDCNAVTCASCRRLWEADHQGISCEAFAAMKDATDPEAQAAGLAKMLTEDGISCPSCHFRYALAKGGCMHFRCIQCQHDFCSGCSKPFKMGQKCGVSEFCAKLGLHAHHPRNCLFYLRDKEPEDLQKLLDMNDIKYNREAPEGMELKSTCQVMEQKETADGMLDDYCGKDIQDGYAGLCRIHYVEYLGQLVNKYKVDPIQIFDSDDLELVLRRASIRLPPKKYRETDDQYKNKLINLIQEELPIDQMEGS